MSTKLDPEKNQLKDPVCDMFVSNDSKYTYKYKEKKYYFCCESCLKKFKKSPEEYLNKVASTPSETDLTANTYTCPMHPEIRQDHPGPCIKCGMALEPETFSGDENNEELIDMNRRFWVCTLLALPVFSLAMIADMMPGWLPNWLPMHLVQWIEFALATPLVIWGGWPFLCVVGTPYEPGISICLH